MLQSHGEYRYKYARSQTSRSACKGGWAIIEEPADHSLWSFAPKGHAAYPAVVKRTVVQDSVGVSIKTDVICEATETACDALVRQFTQMNQNVHP